MSSNLLQGLLSRYLGQYCESFDSSSVGVGAVFTGKVVITDVVLKSSALDALHDLPVRMYRGHIGSITLDFALSQLREKPVIVTMEDVFVQLVPQYASRSRFPLIAELLREQRSKREVLAAVEKHFMETQAAALLAAAGAVGELAALQAAAGGGASSVQVMEGLLSTILANLRVRIARLHVRYEHYVGRAPGALGAPPLLRAVVVSATLALATVETTNERGERGVFQRSVDAVNKEAALVGLALYCDVVAQPFLFSGCTVRAPAGGGGVSRAPSFSTAAGAAAAAAAAAKGAAGIAWMGDVFKYQAATGEVTAGETAPPARGSGGGPAGNGGASFEVLCPLLSPVRATARVHIPVGYPLSAPKVAVNAVVDAINVRLVDKQFSMLMRFFSDCNTAMEARRLGLTPESALWPSHLVSGPSPAGEASAGASRRDVAGAAPPADAAKRRWRRALTLLVRGG